jgi:hypothetical protein
METDTLWAGSLLDVGLLNLEVLCLLKRLLSWLEKH